MCALMFLSVIWTKSWRLPIVGVVLLLVVSVVVGGIFPALYPVAAGPAQREVPGDALHPEQHQRHA